MSPQLAPFVKTNNLPDGVYMATCSCAACDARGTWHSVRLGPFESHGGNDWWKMSWGSLLELEAGTIMDATYFSGVDIHGNPILYPPLHSHHTHVAPSNVNVALAVMMEQHGDWIYQDSDCTPDCTGIVDLFPNHFVVNEPLEVVATINDARPIDSASLTWFYQVSLRIPLRQTGRPVSKHYLWSPMAPGTPFGTFPVAEDVDSFMIYSGTMPHSGTVVKYNFHAHMPSFQEGYLFKVALNRVGLTCSDPLWASRYPQQVGLQRNWQVRDRILNRSSVSWLICQVEGRLMNISGQLIARHGKTQCVPWTFAAGSVFTSVTFNGPARLHDGRNGIAQQHAHWWISYAAVDNVSHYTESYTHMMQVSHSKGVHQNKRNRRFLLASAGIICSVVILAGLSVARRKLQTAVPLI